MRSYSELITIDSFEDRLEYLKLLDNSATSPRHMSMSFYKSHMWLTTRQQIISRDLGFDLGMFGVYIIGSMTVHHINPINEDDIRYQTARLLDPENLITTSDHTHKIIHYGKKKEDSWVERTPGDTKLW